MGEKLEVAVKVGTEFEVSMCKNGKWWSKWVRNRKWWSKWVLNLKWPFMRMESGCESGFQMGSCGQSGCGI